MGQYERELAFDDKPESGYLWCLHCERAYEYGKYRQVKDLQMCPYEDCNGDAVTDAWTWDKILESHSEYPSTPESNKKYPLYS